MQCLHPIVIRNPHADTGLLAGEFSHLEVPCGRCIACRINKTRDWQTRMLMESFYWDDMVFMTYTYDEANIPPDYSIHKKEMQNYFKRLRKACGKEIKYFACGEYGDQFGRPHYHAIIFGLNAIRDRKVIEDSWQKKGNVFFGCVSHKSMRYVAKYTQKKICGPNAFSHYAGREPEFLLCSQGLGDRFMIEYEDRLKNDGYFQYLGKKWPVPQRMKNKFYSRLDKYDSMLKNRVKYENAPVIPMEVRERRIISMINRFARPEYQIACDPYWYEKE